MLVVYPILVFGLLFVIYGFLHGPSWGVVIFGGVVTGLGAVLAGYWFPEGLPSWSDRELAGATGGWTAPVLMRHYRNDTTGRQKASSDAKTLARHGYLPESQSATGSHINVGRTVAPAVLTGGISLLFGASRTKGDIDITFIRH